MEKINIVDFQKRKLNNFYILFTEFKGALTELHVLTELKTHNLGSIFYWSSEKGIAEIDYLIQIAKCNIPIEVKSNENLQAKSLRIFTEKYNTKINVRTSMSNYRKEEKLIYLKKIRNI